MNSSEEQSDGISGRRSGPALNVNGTVVAFDSLAANPVNGDSDDVDDVFVRDRMSGTTERVSVGGRRRQGNAPSLRPAISADGNVVAFDSDATNRVSADTNAAIDVFVRDRASRETTRVSVASGGAQADADSFGPAISADGRFVAFESDASNLVPDKTTTNTRDVYVHDRLTGTTERVSVVGRRRQGNAPSLRPAISADGRFVAFGFFGSGLIANDTIDAFDVSVHDRVTGATERVSVDSAGAEANRGSAGPKISGDGRFVTFASRATDLVPGDTNNRNDIFVRDRVTGTTERVNVARTAPRRTVTATGRACSAASASARTSATTAASSRSTRSPPTSPPGTPTRAARPSWSRRASAGRLPALADALSSGTWPIRRDLLRPGPANRPP